MLEIIPVEDDSVIAARIAGKIEKSDIEAFTQVTDDKLSRHDKLHIYVELESFPKMTFDALMADFKFGMAHFRDFDRKAVVSNKDWAEKLSVVGDKLFPSIAVRHFRPNEKDKALTWASSGEA